MSTVLWANILADGKVTSDEADRYALYKHADKLDAIGKKLGLGSFNAMCDTTDVRFNLGEFDLPEGMQSSNEIMATDGAWLDAVAAIRLLDGLLEHLHAHKVRFGLFSDAYADVVNELAEALEYARTAPADAKFNFGVVT